MGAPALKLLPRQVEQLAQIIGTAELDSAPLQPFQQIRLVVTAAWQPQPLGAAGAVDVDLPRGRPRWWWPVDEAQHPPGQGIEPVARGHRRRLPVSRPQCDEQRPHGKGGRTSAPRGLDGGSTMAGPALPR
jgi:hypothetical protein